MDLSSENQEYDGDEFYEEIEAPKFVDFKVLDRYRPDDGYWFCMRVGCDQKHEEEMDADKISRNFALRVMAARSPNVKLRKALYRKCPSPTMKCPFTAPAKPSKPRLLRTPVISSITQKLIDAEGYHKSISKNNPKGKILTPKSLTAPRTQKGTLNRVPFGTAPNNPKAVVMEGLKNTTPVGKKTMVFKSPEKGIKEMPLASKQKPVKKTFKEVRRDYSRPWCVNIKTKVKGSPKNIKKVADSSNGDEVPRFEKGEVSGGSKEQSDGSEELLEFSEKNLQNSRTLKEDNTHEEEHKENASADDDKENATKAMYKENATKAKKNLRKEIVSPDADDDKENATKDMRNDFSEENNISANRLLNFNCDDSGRKRLGEEKAPNKTLKDSGKSKRAKPTSQKPFRLRTDERVILKEAAQAHLERRGEEIMSTPQKEAGMVCSSQGDASQKTGKNQNRIRFPTSSKDLKPTSKRKLQVTKDSVRSNGVPKQKTGDLETSRQLRVIQEKKIKRNPSPIPNGATMKTRDKVLITADAWGSSSEKMIRTQAKR